MKKFALFTIAALLGTSCLAQRNDNGYPITQVPFTNVEITPNTFWGQRLKASRDVTIPLAFGKCEETDRYRNFQQAAAHIQNPEKTFKVKGMPRGMGFCFSYWSAKKSVLESYGIEWRSPRQMNPRVLFD